MSLRYEQYRALHNTRNLLHRILVEPRISHADLKMMASRCARHFPPLDTTGAPMFSNDQFECPNLDNE